MSEESFIAKRVREYLNFFNFFLNQKGVPQLLIVSFLLSLGVMSMVGIVPDILSDRYARLNYGYKGDHCSTFDRVDKPYACQHGSNDAQRAAALATLVRNLITLSSNSVVGTISDFRGRRTIMAVMMLLRILLPFSLIAVQLIESLHPIWYYVAESLTGLVDYMSVPLTILSDIMPQALRGPSFGVYLSAFYVGYSVAPSFSLLLSHFYVSVVAFGLLVIGFIFAFLFLPETLSEQVAQQNLSDRREVHDSEESLSSMISSFVTRPFRDISILNRNWFFRLLSLGAFFSAMVHSSDTTLVIYYIEDQLNVRDSDLARMFLVLGVVGIVMQGILLQILIKVLSEYGLTITSFFSGVVHNLLYGLATKKSTLYVAFCLSQLTKTNIPMLTSMASNNADMSEQGRIQGALFALMAAANAIGPIVLQTIYDQTKSRPGTMWGAASILYFIGLIFVFFLPRKKVSSLQSDGRLSERGEERLQEPLLDTTQETP